MLATLLDSFTENLRSCGGPRGLGWETLAPLTGPAMEVDTSPLLTPSRGASIPICTTEEKNCRAPSFKTETHNRRKSSEGDGWIEGGL